MIKTFTMKYYQNISDIIPMYVLNEPGPLKSSLWIRTIRHLKYYSYNALYAYYKIENFFDHHGKQWSISPPEIGPTPVRRRVRSYLQ